MTIVLIWAVATVGFLMLYMMPGDPALIILGGGESFQPAQDQIDALRSQLGLDEPFLVQYVRYLGGVARGDFGDSIVTGRPIAEQLGVRFLRTLQLLIPTVVISASLGIALGLAAARRRNTWVDNLASVAALSWYSVPTFVLASLIVLLFSISLGWLPASGYASLGDDWAASLRYSILPVIALASAPTAVTMRITRSSVLDQATRDYVRTARSKGISENRVYYGHVLRNASLPIVSIVGLQIGTAIAGSVIVEQVFNWPGVGSYLLQAVGGRDFPSVRAVVLAVALVVVTVNLVTDVLYALINPRIRYR